MYLRILSNGLSAFGKDKTLDIWRQSLIPWRELGDDEDEIKEIFASQVSLHLRIGLNLPLKMSSVFAFVYCCAFKCKLEGW